MATFESNTIKIGLGLPTRIHSTELLAALKIDSLENRIKLQQTSLFNRLLNNNTTKTMIGQINNSSSTHPKSLLREISKYLLPNTKLNAIARRCHTINCCLKSTFNNKYKTCPKVNRIKTWLKNIEKYRENIIASCIAFI